MWIRPEDHRVVGDSLAQLRKRVSLTQSEIARLLNKPQSFVSSYEHGQRRIDVLELLLIVGALGGDPLAVFSDIIARRSARPVDKG